MVCLIKIKYVIHGRDQVRYIAYKLIIMYATKYIVCNWNNKMNLSKQRKP
jgi:hypothetical protein